MIRHFKLATLLFMASKQVIAKVWRTPNLHTTEVVSRMQFYLVNDKLTGLLNDRVSAYETLWTPWVDAFMQQGFDNALLQLSQP